jgi:hypothetical protein
MRQADCSTHTVIPLQSGIHASFSDLFWRRTVITLRPEHFAVAVAIVWPCVDPGLRRDDV